MNRRDKGRGKRDEARAAERAEGAVRLGRSGGFTIIELSVVLVIIGIVASIAFVTFGRAIRTGREAGERMFLNSLSTAVQQFKQDNGFFPPLLNDNIDPTTELRLDMPLDRLTRQPLARNAAYLRGEVNPTGPRWSVYSLPFYLTGTLGAMEDGVDGPGYTKVLEDGTFSRKGRKIESLFDFGRDAARIRRHPDPANAANEAVFVDRWGKVSASTTWMPLNTIRYYRWEPRFYPAGTPNAGTVQNYNVPKILGLPPFSEDLRSAGYAILSKGPDGLVNDNNPNDARNLDNLVEVGK